MKGVERLLGATCRVRPDRRAAGSYACAAAITGGALELVGANAADMHAILAGLREAGVDPERTTQLDLGAQYRGARMDAWVSAYAGRIDDFILFRYQPAGMTSVTSQASNVDARIHGAEAGVEFRPTPAWTLGATTAWAWGAHTAAGQTGRAACRGRG